MDNVSRRNVLKIAGGMTASMAIPGRLLAVFEDGSVVRQGHAIPADKKLDPAWRKSLFERGTKEVWSGAELDSIGMPIGGIAAGQLYLKGDGTLGWWEIFNHHVFYGYGLTSYAKRAIPALVEFDLFLWMPNQKSIKLDRTGFSKVRFQGEHPIAEVTLSDPACPIHIKKTVYSPFIPLNAKDSALPATVIEIEGHNTGSEPAVFCIEAIMTNPLPKGQDPTRSIKNGFMHVASPVPDPFESAPTDAGQPILIADFEGETYGDWRVEGEAFGTGPAPGTLPNQNRVSGFEGKRLVNTFLRGDDTKGRLISPEFTVDRRFINFKIGGGNHPGKTCINLLLEGKVQRTSSGLNDEELLWDAWNVEEFRGRKAHIEIVDDQTGPWGHINIDHIEQSNSVRSMDDLKRRHGDVNRSAGAIAVRFLDGNATGYRQTAKGVGATMSDSGFMLKPGEKRKISLVVAWHFPNHSRGRQYANWFKDAEDVASYVAANFERLQRDTKLWRDTYYDSTLPYWLLDRLHSTVSNLATGTTEWWGNGRFWAWEGVVCCSGTCTHVWNYEHALARLFPEIQRNIRERQDFGEGFHPETGLVGFRSDNAYAADGQCGTILKAYREHQCSIDDAFLKKNWASIKKALQFLMSHDANGDGMIEDSQHNTYDINFFGANTFVGALYLGALRAGEEMATELKDKDFAKQCRELFEKGQKATMKRLWNGEYFIQEVDQDKVKEYQYGPGCLSDQLFGQGWAHQVGLGHLYPADKVKTALKSVWRYNWTPDVGPYNKAFAPERPFAVPGEGGLFICTWPKGGRQKEPVRYRDEVWTGIEYQVAGHMIWEGMVEEGLAICRAVHERYHPAKRNPYNEVECSDHYARALASWGVFTALCGFSYHGPKGIIGFAPKITPSNFKAAFTAAEGWGTYSQTITSRRMLCKIELKWGKMRVKEIVLETDLKGAVHVYLGDRRLPFTATRTGRKLTVTLTEKLDLTTEQWLRVTIDSV